MSAEAAQNGHGRALGTVVVTGGASGLGAAVAAAVRDGGGTPVVLDLRPPADGFAFHEVDLSRPRDAEAAVRAVAEEHGGLDGVVTAAGTDACGDILDVDPRRLGPRRDGQPARHGRGGARRAPRARALARADRHRVVHARPARPARGHGVLREQVRRRRLHPRAGHGAGRPRGRDPAHPRRHADALLRRPPRLVQAGAGPAPQRPRRRRPQRRLRAPPARRLRGARAARRARRRSRPGRERGRACWSIARSGSATSCAGSPPCAGCATPSPATRSCSPRRGRRRRWPR